MLPTDGEKVLTKYAEPMVGGGALFFSILSKYDFEELYISDINAELINAYQAVKNDVDNLIRCQNRLSIKIRLYISIRRIARFLKHPLLLLTILMCLTITSK